MDPFELLDKDFHLAAFDGELEYVQYYISCGWDVNQVNEYGYIPLHYCVRDGHMDVMKELLAAGSDVNAKGFNGKTPLHESVNGETVKALTAAGADVNAKDKYGNTSLHHVYLDDGVFTWCDKEEIYNKMYPSHNIDVVEALIAAGADINAKNDERMTPLHCSRKVEVVKALIAAGADINAKDKLERTPLHFCRNKKVVKALIAAGADMNAKDRYGNTPLHDCEKIEVVEALIAGGADINAKDRLGRTPLHFCNGVKVVKALIAAGAEVNAKDDCQMTPLSYSLFRVRDSKCFAIIVKMLIAASVDNNSKTHSVRADEMSFLMRFATIATGKDLFRYAFLYGYTLIKPDFINDAEILNGVWNVCENQVKNLKETFLGKSCTSFFKFLTETDENKLALYSSEENFNLNNESERASYIKKFLMFEEDIEAQFINGKLRADLLHKSQEILINYFRRSLPIEVIRKITQCQKNEDLETFLSLHCFNKNV